MTTTISDILTNPFFKRPLEEQIRIVMGGRPRPKIRAYIPKDKVESGYFSQAIYNEETWLCGCDKQDGFFCWTCMLFVSEKYQWSISGLHAYGHLHKEVKKHKYSENHLNGMFQYQMFLKNNIHKTSVDSVEQNLYLKKLNSEALKRLIDIVCSMVSQISPCAIETIVPELSVQCVGMLKFLKPYDDPDVVDKAICIVQTNPGIVTDIIVLIANILKKEIVKELKSSTFVSVILSGHRDAKQRMKYSIVVRYMKDGVPYERLVGFSLLDDRDLILVVTQVVTELEISDKFLALSCDGLVAPVKNLQGFLLSLSYHYPNTYFVPWHLHEFHSVLLQSVAAHPAVNVFVRTLKSIKEYFESSPANCKAFHDSCYREVLDLSHLKMTDSQFLRVLKMYRNHFLKFFNSFARENFGRYASDDIFIANGYAKRLQDSCFVFLLELFFQHFQYTAYVNEMLTSNSPDCVFEWHIVCAILDVLKKQKEDGYMRLLELFTTEITNNNPKQMEILETKGEMKLFFLDVYQDIIAKLLKTIHLRYRHLKKLNFLGIFDCENQQIFTMTRNYFKNLLDARIPHFTYCDLVNEVKILTNYGRIFGRKSVFEMVIFFRQVKLNETFKNCYKLAEFIITLPCKPIDSGNRITKLDNINSCASCSFSHQAECLGHLYIENDFLKYLKSQMKFYDLVIFQLDALNNIMGKNVKSISMTNVLCKE